MSQSARQIGRKVRLNKEDALGCSGGDPHAGVVWTGSSPTGRSPVNTGLVGGPTPPVLSPTILEVSLPVSACGLSHRVLKSGEGLPMIW